MDTEKTSTVLSNTTTAIITATTAVTTVTNATNLVIDAIKHLVDIIYRNCNNAECNKEICFRIKTRLKIAKCDVEKVERNLDIKKEFHDKSYYLAFERFKKVLLKVDNFTRDVSTIRNFKRTINLKDVKNVKDRYENLTKEFDECMYYLQFNVVVDSEEEIQKIDKELKEVSHLLNKIGDQYEMLILEINMIDKDDADKSEIAEEDLIDPIIQEEKNSNVIKKIYKPLVIDVACISSKHDYVRKLPFISASKLSKLSQLPHILRFYGLSTIYSKQFMVFEWADYGNLKELYDKFVIPWPRKIQIINEICCGISFLRMVNILHRDMRCANIFVLRDLSIKIGFNHLRYSYALHPSVIPWMAPEYSKYNFESEMFSFGMLIWELCYEKVPYEGWDEPRIKDHVLKGKRENVSEGRFKNSEEKEIQIEFIKIINKAWHHSPNSRISIEELSYKLDELAKKHPLLPDTQLLQNNTLNFKGNNSQVSTESLSLKLELKNQVSEEFSSPNLDPEEIIEKGDFIIPLEDGVKLHYAKKYEDAWKCFIQNSELSEAKFWQGNYYLNGYVVEKDLDQARKLYKEAADENHIPAQYEYAAMHSKKEDDETTKDKNFQEIMRYLKLAAENENFDAICDIGNIYLKGKFNVPKDEKRGLDYLKLAAENRNASAMYDMGNICLEGKFNVPKDEKRGVNYLILAAENRNVNAMHDMGIIYLEGKYNVSKYESLGLNYLKLAAGKNNKKAIEKLEKLGIQI
ncbi:kinase-like protein [Gigaspora margarita]|uniref:Kinase-like protein n=1 Tax=Gigaspora margarita TaxID=4874 RepID=A0A8H3XF03_GIGMA|nr:kinase-like protein [Gigaspora margarita]